MIGWVQNLSMVSLTVLLLVLLTAAALAGYGLRRRQASKREVEGASLSSETQESYIVSAVLGLLALLTGFTFSLVLDRFETRRENVLVEANAIGTTYLRAQLLQEPHRARISGLLVEYTDNRIKLGEARLPEGRALLEKNDRLIVDLWTATVAAFPTIRSVDFSSSFLETMNQLIDMDAARKAARMARVPDEIFAVLMIYQVMAAGVLGYVLVGYRGRLAAGLLLFLFALALLLIIDINRPTSGGVRESQQPMISLRESLESQPPETFDRFNSPGPEPSPT